MGKHVTEPITKDTKLKFIFERKTKGIKKIIKGFSKLGN